MRSLECQPWLDDIEHQPGPASEPELTAHFTGIINTHAFHNPHILRSTLPRYLVLPIPLHQDRQAKHIEIAGNLQVRVAQETKRTAKDIP